MPSAARTIIINRPVSEVFAFFTNPANDAKWRSHVAEIVATGAPAVGTTIKQAMEGPGGRKIPADIRITTFAPDSKYAFEVIAGPVRPAGEMIFVPQGEATQVTFSLTADIGGVKKFVLSGPVQKSMDGEMANLDKAKRLIEAGG